MSNETPLPAAVPEESEFQPGRSEPGPFVPVYPTVRRKFQNRLSRHVLLLALTILTTTVVGADHYAAFLSQFGRAQVHLGWGLLGEGLW